MPRRENRLRGSVEDHPARGDLSHPLHGSVVGVIYYEVARVFAHGGCVAPHFIEYAMPYSGDGHAVRSARQPTPSRASTSAMAPPPRVAQALCNAGRVPPDARTLSHLSIERSRRCPPPSVCHTASSSLRRPSRWTTPEEPFSRPFCKRVSAPPPSSHVLCLNARWLDREFSSSVTRAPDDSWHNLLPPGGAAYTVRAFFSFRARQEFLDHRISTHGTICCAGPLRAFMRPGKALPASADVPVEPRGPPSAFSWTPAQQCSLTRRQKPSSITPARYAGAALAM